MSAPPGPDGFPWHRAFHPLCGADPLTLAGLVWRRGPPSLSRAPTFAVACAMAALRLPFTLGELALDRLRPGGTPPPPVFVIGHPRSGTTHLHNALAASGAFTTVPPVIAALPWERRSIGPLMRPFVDPRLPSTRLIDGVALQGSQPTEDELALANIGGPSYFHALYFPSNFAADYRDGLLGPRDAAARRRRERVLRRYVRTMGRRGGAPLLLKNPAYTAAPDMLTRLFPGARVIHIRRDPRAVFASTRRTLEIVLSEMALQDSAGLDLDEVVLDTYPRVMAGLDRAREAMPPDGFAEIRFDELIATPDAVLQRLWSRLDLPGSVEAAGRAVAYCHALSGFRSGGARLSPAQDRALERRWPREIAAWRASSAA